MRRLALIVAGVLLSIAVPRPGHAGERRPQRSAPASYAVIALNDTGIDPYHDEFADSSPRAFRHPSTYIDGFPRSARALRLSLDEPNYWKALDRDCERVWAKVKPGRLYWIPGTRIIGAISFSAGTEFDCTDPQPHEGIILDVAGHGTMTASRAAGNDTGACPECLIVSVEGWGRDWHEGVDWMTDNAGWIDVQSHSWGITRPVADPTGTVSVTPDFVRSMERAASTEPFFRASGNAPAVVGEPTYADPQYTPSTIVVGAHDSGRATLWHGFTPDVVADGCGAPAAQAHSTSEVPPNAAAGTSSATPWAAGAAARLILEARRLTGSADTGVSKGLLVDGPHRTSAGPLRDGRLTNEELRTVLLHSATARPKGDDGDGKQPCPTGDRYGATPAEWSSVPKEAPGFVSIGYGAIDRASTELALDVLAGRSQLPERGPEDAFFAGLKLAKDEIYALYSSL